MSTISAEDRIPVERVPKTQALVSKTFTSPPLDGSLHPAELYKWNSDNNSDHPLFLFDDDGEVTTIRWPETVEAINCGVKRVRKIMNWSVGLYKPPIIGILAASDTITYFVMMTAIYRAGYVAFPISPRNSPAAIAHLVKELDVRHILVGQEPKVQGLASEALKRLSTSIVQPQTSNMPLFDDLYGQPKVSPQDIVYERRGINDVIIYLHSSGSTSHPKPIPITNRRFLELSLAYHFGDVDVTGLIFSLHIVPMFHALGVMQMACIVSTGIVASVFKPQFPAQVPGVKAHYDASVATDTDVVISVPSIIEEWAANLECVRWLASRTGVICGGGSLSDSVGSYLASQGVNTNTLYGSTECGGMSSILTTKSIDDWGYFAFARNITPQLIPQGDGICELILVSQPFCKLLVTNTTVGGMNAFATSDLLVRHPTNPDLWKIYGRSDDQIIHTTGEKTNPCPLEAILNQDPHIKGAVMFGHRRSRAGFVVEPHPSFAFDIKDEVKLADFCNKIWPSVQKANAFAPQHSRVFQDMIIAADCSKSFTYTAKGTARRQAVLEDYEVEISQLYDSISALSQEPVPLPSNWSPETTHDFVRKVVSSTLATAVSDRGDLFHAGCDR
ncbi:acetyl-CoA synthetase-like protein [Coprinopsis marcescibilis]|uniref:Acetyl-CoA synthetase-like protein n=1 Tax=Coprinopsis marcescibilis TaxID=230819 RepID=A0A5C3KHV9_COPMA|nr:acetyl-CoA synthetase-like protein [Coprinopsis marcescibilis]